MPRAAWWIATDAGSSGSDSTTGSPASAGALVSTVDDLHRWTRALTGGRVGYAGESVVEMRDGRIVHASMTLGMLAEHQALIQANWESEYRIVYTEMGKYAECIGRDGRVVERFAPTVRPDQLKPAIEKLL